MDYTLPEIVARSIAPPTYRWEIRFSQDVFVLSNHAPNRFHRWMCRWLLGIHWTPLQW